MWYYLVKLIRKILSLREKNSMVRALDVANTFLVRAKKDNIDITPMKLQKLIYILYKCYLKDTKSRLFPERFKVWQYGPVVPEVYQVFKNYRSNRITSFYMNPDGSFNTVAFKVNSNFDKAFNFVWNKYSRIDGIYLSQLTHQPDTAWSKADSRDERELKDKEIYQEKEYELDV